MRRTLMCGEVRREHMGQQVVLQGWVNRRRDHGGVIFIDLRDRAGIVQIVANPGTPAYATADAARPEYVLEAQGTVRARPAGMANPNLPTGEVEVLCHTVTVLNTAKTPPFVIADAKDITEEVRLRYRYLDLRRERMQRILELRHRVIKHIRDYLDTRGFWEIETPILFKSTPEGARDYLVPSRLYPGKFYALPQSPQQFKQLLMVAGIDKYFQIARCMRDEDQRADRQPEFTQLDIEMSFNDEEDVFNLLEPLYTELVEKLSPKRVLYKPFPRLSYAEAIEKYGTDKPDLRFSLTLHNLTALLKTSSFSAFRSVAESSGQVKAICVPGGVEKLSRARLDALVDFMKAKGGKGLAWLQYKASEVGGSIAKFFSSEELRQIAQLTSAKAGDLVLLAADAPKPLALVMDALRRELARQLGLLDDNVLAFAWLVDMPLFEWNADEQRWQSAHHPFTRPVEADLPYLDTDPGRVRAHAYDLVCNNYEVAGGSLRIYRRDQQEKIFQVLGLTPERTQKLFSHLLEAFEYGTPPHGGIAGGMERLIMLLVGETNIREVIAFPKNQQAMDLMSGSPSEVSEAQLKELRIKVLL